MNEPTVDPHRLQSLTTEHFFYFFLRLRKGEVRHAVAVLKKQFPDDSPEQLALRLIATKARLSLLSGSLLALPALFPSIGQTLKFIGMAGGASVITRMNLNMILEIATVFGKDVDDVARVPELMTVVAASGLSVASPLLIAKFALPARYAVPVGAVSVSAMTSIIGRTALAFYRGNQEVPDEITSAIQRPEPAVAR